MLTQEAANPASPEAGTASPVQVKKIGHIVFRVNDMDRSTRFWTEIMGFHVSDRNEQGMVFLRNAADHHTIALAAAKQSGDGAGKERAGFDHCALEVPSVSDLFRIRSFLKERGVQMVFEGRRGPGCNPGVEFLDPDGNQIELYASMDQIGWDGQSRPPHEWRRATSLEEAVSNPVPGVTYN